MRYKNLVGAAAFIGVVLTIGGYGRGGIWPAVVYVVASVICFFAYGIDKWKAKADRPRTSESTLHLLELLGGWPGALVAQSLLHHKSQKTSFRIWFWIIVAVHLVLVGVWAYLTITRRP